MAAKRSRYDFEVPSWDDLLHAIATNNQTKIKTYEDHLYNHMDEPNIHHIQNIIEIMNNPNFFIFFKKYLAHVESKRKIIKMLLLNMSYFDFYNFLHLLRSIDDYNGNNELINLTMPDVIKIYFKTKTIPIEKLIINLLRIMNFYNDPKEKQRFWASYFENFIISKTPDPFSYQDVIQLLKFYKDLDVKFSHENLFFLPEIIVNRLKDNPQDFSLIRLINNLLQFDLMKDRIKECFIKEFHVNKYGKQLRKDYKTIENLYQYVVHPEEMKDLFKGLNI
jgi:hypothetical protein